jgi:hypothetical protein
MKNNPETEFELNDGTKISVVTLHEILKWVAGHKDHIADLNQANIPVQFKKVEKPVFRGVCFQQKDYERFLKSGHHGKSYESWTTDFFVAKDFAEYSDGLVSVVFKHIPTNCILNVSKFLHDPKIEEKSKKLFPKLWSLVCDMRTEDEVIIDGDELHLNENDITWRRDFEPEDL